MAHTTIRQPALMHIDIQQTPHHQGLTMWIQQCQQWMNTPEAVPDTVERIVVRLTRVPIRILVGVVLRANHAAVYTAPESSLEVVVNTAGLDSNDIQLGAPCVFSCFGDKIEVGARDLFLSIGARLYLADEAHANTCEDLVIFLRLLELDPATCRAQTRSLSHIAGSNFQTLRASCARVRPDTCVLDGGTVEI